MMTYSVTTETMAVIKRDKFAKQYSLLNGWYLECVVCASWILIVLCTVTKMKSRE